MTDDTIHRASTTAPVNIAVVKCVYLCEERTLSRIFRADTECRYWGKRDATLNLPTNSSLSVTLSQKDLRTHTTASCSPTYTGPDSLLLNNATQSLETPRSIACLRSLRALRAQIEAADPAVPTLSKFSLRIVSQNNFPTAAGLASSAAGFAALIRAIADLYELPQSPEELSLIARQGSGSACRSLLGGYVAWDVGTREDGTDSKAREVAPQSHWPEVRALILVVSAEKKGVSSTAGMQATVASSKLFKTRAQEVVPQHMKEMERAIKERDFETFGRLAMKESNNFHACCLDTDPPITYLNDVSRAAMKVVEGINEAAKRIVAAYTFDAGPNAVVYYLEHDEGNVAGTFHKSLSHIEGWKRVPATPQIELTKNYEVVLGAVKQGVSRIIQTGVGGGPEKVNEHLIDEQGNAVNP